MKKRQVCAHTLQERARELEQELIRVTEECRALTKLVEQTTLLSTAAASWGPGAVLRRFIDANVIPVMRASATGEFIEVNDAFVNMIGYSRQELLGGMNWLDLTPPDLVYLDEIAIASLRKTGRAMPYEKAYYHKDGHPIPFLIGISALNSSGDDCFCILIDLSDDKKAEAALKASEAIFKTMINSIPQIVFITNQASNVEFINKKWYEFTGLNPGDEKNWQNIIHPDDLGRLLQEILRTYEARAPMEIEIRHRAKDGEYRWGLVRSLPMTDIKGNELRYGTCTDINDAKHAEHDLKESEIELRALADAIPQIVFTANPDGSIDFFNQRWFEYTGLNYDQSIHDGWQLLIHPKDLEQYIKDWQHALKTGDTYEGEFRLRQAVGFSGDQKIAYRWHLARAVAIRDSEGDISKWFATWTEIENQKKGQSRHHI